MHSSMKSTPTIIDDATGIPIQLPQISRHFARYE
jgi:hypothetical protein